MKKIPQHNRNMWKLALCFVLFTTVFSSAQTITTLGTTSLPVPAGSTYAVIECLGAGGGGGMVSSSGNGSAAAGGGGGGAYSKSLIAVTPGQTLDVFVGVGGAGPTTNAEDGAPGEASSVTYNSTVVCNAAGGLGGGGKMAGYGLGGWGGNNGVGFLFAGGKGGNGIATTVGGGGGGAAGSAGNGANGGSPAGGAGGAGGFGSGTGGNGGNPWNGANGTLYGAGGGGASGTDTYSVRGNGAQGKVVITFCTNTFTLQPSTSAQSLCVGGVSTQLAVAANSGPYMWYSNTVASNSGGTATGVTTATFTPPTGSAGSTYYYCVAGSGACAIPSEVSGVVSVGGAIVASDDTNLCSGESVTLSASAPGATGYLWSPGGATTSSITVSPSSTTVYSVTTTGGSCPGTTNITVTASPDITFSATATSDNLNGYVYSGSSPVTGEILYLNAYPIENVLLQAGFNNSLTGAIGGTWTTSVVNAGSTCGGQNAQLSMVTSDTYLGTGLTIGPQEGSHMIRFNSGFTDAGGLGYLTSPTFNTVGYTGLIVDFWFLQFVNSNGGEYVSLEYKVGAGAWTSFSSNYYRAGVSTQCPSWFNFSLELPAATLNQPSVQIRFKFYSGGCAGQQMLLDNVRLSGVTVAGGYTFYANYLWTAVGTGVSANIVNPFIRSTTTSDLNNTNIDGSITFNVTLTDNNGCVYSASDVVNINPDVNNGNMGAATANPTVLCASPGTTDLSFNPTGAYPSSVQWQMSTVGPGGPWTDIPGGTTINYQATNITQTTWFRIKPITDFSLLSGACEGSFSSTPVMVSLSTFDAGAVQTPGEEVCVGEDPVPFEMTDLPISPGTTGFTYQWYAYDGTTTAPTGSTAPMPGWTAVGAQGNGTPTPFLWTDNFDGANSWTLAGNFAVGAPVAGNTVTVPYSAPNVLGTVLNGNYANSATQAANYAVSPTIDLSGVSNPVLTYYSRSQFLATCLFCAQGPDRGYVYLSIDNGVTYGAALETVGVNEAGYVLHTVNIPAAADQSQVKIKFTMQSDASNVKTGWNIDNVTIEGDIVSIPTYDPPVTGVGSTTTTYAVFIETIGGPCPFTGWADLQYTVTIDPCPLPIELASFSGECEGGRKIFKWTTISEDQNDFFTLEHSANGSDYEALAIVDGAGSSQMQHDYTYVVMEPKPDYVFYRLKQTDFDGKKSYSNVIHVSCTDKEPENTIVVYPNPARDKVVVHFNQSMRGEYNVQLIDLLGKVNFSERISIDGKESFVIDVSEIATGNYVVILTELESQSSVGHAKFTKIN